MPNPHAHFALAEEIARRLQHPILEAHLGSFHLGSVSPDIRVMTRGPREDTHFSQLSDTDPWAGVLGMFKAHPQLRDARALSGATQAFICGFVSHLIADQAWILRIYRPYFGNPNLFADRDYANILDRALQLELDRQARDATHAFVAVQAHLVRADDGVEIGFISPETLQAWRNRVAEMAAREFTWDRLRFMLRRAVPDQNAAAQESVERFLADVPAGVEAISLQVPKGEVEAFREAAIQETVRFSQEYLS